MTLQGLTTWLAAAARWLHDYSLLAPLMQLLLATLLAYLFAERWQRWRQRREFQHQTLVTFSELSLEMMDLLTELLTSRGRISPGLFAEKHRELVSRWTMFLSIRGVVMAAYGRAFVLGADYQGVFNALDALRAFVRAPAPVPRAQFEPEQERFLAYREAVVARMVRAMGLFSKQEWLAEKASAEARVLAADEAAAPDAAPRVDEEGRHMAGNPDDDSLRTFVTYQGQYHNHKEQLGYAAAAFYVSGALLLFFGENRWSSYPRGPILFLLAATGLLGLFYVVWQFRLRALAACRIDGFLTTLKWPNAEQSAPSGSFFQRWAAPGAALVVMALWGGAAFVRVACHGL